MSTEMKLYNTKTRKKEIFQPIEAGKVRMYVCGPTVYDYCHIGHGRVYVVFDVFYRVLSELGYEVTYVRNLTDIDDKIIKRAQESGSDWSTIVDTYIKAFHDDMSALGNLPPQAEPRATENIDGMINMISNLIEKNIAYAAGGDVYFAVSEYKDYCALSGRSQEDLLVGARVEENKLKRNPLDFALWKAAKPGEPSWPSPWGAGRPGWHIECSVMSQKHLGETFDLHGGGRDLIFPHHENERAQSEAASGKTYCNYWLHNGFINLKQEKMSKSLGNLVLIRDLVDKHHNEVIRHFILSSHYRSPIEFDDAALSESRSALERIYRFLSDANSLEGTIRSEIRVAFVEALADDLNTPRALAVLFDAVKEGNRLLKEGKQRQAADIAATLKEAGKTLALLQSEPSEFLQGNRDDVDPSWVEAKIAERVAAKKARNFTVADQIRGELLEKNVVLEDRADGSTHWRIQEGDEC